jgi:hypothetical protein
MAAVPLYVVKALALAQESGRTNMIDREEVIKLVEDAGNARAVEWLNKASNADFMDALNEMGEYISMPDGNRAEEGGDIPRNPIDPDDPRLLF